MLAKGFSVPDLQHPDLPPAVSWFPLTAGWYWLGALLLIPLVFAVMVRVARWRRNLWRRQARSELAQLESADNWLQWVKRIQLVHLPRPQVSQQVTPDQLLKNLPLDSKLAQRLCQRYCQADNQLSQQDNAQIRQQLRRWLETLPDV